jgi:prefoldin subunit 5
MSAAAPPLVPLTAKSQFIEDVAAHMKTRSFEQEMARLQENLQKFKYAEAQAFQAKLRLLSKLPEIERSLEAVDGLISRQDSDEPVAIDFELSDGFYAKATVHKPEAVNLWLGAGVMVEYPLAEAQQLLTSNLAACKQRIEELTKDLEVIKDCQTVTEVSIARVFNHDVETRRGGKAGPSS